MRDTRRRTCAIMNSEYIHSQVMRDGEDKSCWHCSAYKASLDNIDVQEIRVH